MNSHYLSQRGVTMIELIVALAVLAILVGVGAPSMGEAVKNSRMSNDYNEFLGAFHRARSESVKSSENVVICANLNDSNTTCGGDWSQGAIVYIDRDPVLSTDTNSVGEEDEIVAIIGAPNKSHTVSAIASRDNVNSESVSWFRYSPSGRTNWNSGTLQICDPERELSRSRAVNIVLTGDARRARPANGGSVPLNVFGQQICAGSEGSAG